MAGTAAQAAAVVLSFVKRRRGPITLLYLLIVLVFVAGPASQLTTWLLLWFQQLPAAARIRMVGVFAPILLAPLV